MRILLTKHNKKITKPKNYENVSDQNHEVINRDFANQNHEDFVNKLMQQIMQTNIRKKSFYTCESTYIFFFTMKEPGEV